MLTEKTFDAGAVKINYAEGPASGPPLVLIHGALLNWQDLASLIHELTKHWHVYACDGRGHGKSGRTPSGYRVVDFFPDTVSFIQRQVARPCVLIGHSLGGVLALGVAAAIPELVRAVVLIDPAIALRELSAQQLIPTLPDSVAAIGQILIAGRTTGDVLNEMYPSIDEATIQNLDTMIRGIDLEFADTLMDQDRFVDGLDLKLILQRVTCPMLLLYVEPESGAIIRDSDLEFVRANAPHVVAAPIKGAGHQLHNDQPAQVLAQITRFLDSLPAQSAS